MRRFKELRRKRMRAEWRQLSVLVLFLVILAAWIALGDGWSQLLAAMCFGAIAAILAVGWLIGFDARSLRFAWGASGERWTAAELDRLDASWRVFHDIASGRANWDHVAVGPTGIYVIDTKNLSERAVVDESGIRAGRLRFAAGASRASAVRLKEAVDRTCGRTLWVQAVVAVWGEIEGGASERDRVLYVCGDNLIDSLQARRQRLTPAEVEQVAQAIEAIQSRTAHRGASPIA